jgi:threonine dehydratase
MTLANKPDMTPDMTTVLKARARLSGRIQLTPTVESRSLSARLDAPVLLKLEQRQTTGSFKLRGAMNAVLSLSEEERARGVTAASTGNHGRGLAYAAKATGARAVICMSELVPQNKVEGIKRLGAEIRIVGKSQDDAQVEVDRLVAEEGLTMLPPFDHPQIIAGQGTLGLEMLEQAPELETVLVPLSGGGLISGVALALKTLKPSIRVVGVSMERGAAMDESLKAGKPVFVEELPTLADSLGGGIGLKNRYTFAMVRELVDEVILLTEEEIAAAIRHAYWEEQEVVEGSGAVGIGAVLAGKLENAGGPVGLLLSGRNIDMGLHHKLVSGETVEL